MIAMTQAEPKYRFIGIAGMPLSGKDTCAKHLEEKFGYLVINLSSVVTEELKKRLGRKPTRKDLQEMGLALREEEGRGAVAKRVIEDWIPWVVTNINRAVEAGGERWDSAKLKYVFNGIRSREEAERFRKEYGKDFSLISICASLKIRYERAKSRKREGFDTFDIDEFRELDVRELRLGLGDALAVADHYLLNEGTKDELIVQLRRILLDP